MAGLVDSDMGQLVNLRKVIRGTVTWKRRPRVNQATVRLRFSVLPAQSALCSTRLFPRVMTLPMPYYTWFNGHGRRSLADELGDEDPFGLAPADIVDRIVAAGYTPWVEAPQPEMLPTLGTVTEVEREGVTYIVSVSREAAEIDVQEWRAEAYDRVE